MRKGNGGIIGPLNNPTLTVASGIFSMDEQQQSLSARQWPGTPSATKPNPPSFANSSSFTASISGATMTVSAIASGSLAVGQVISGVGVTQYTIITAQLTGTTGSTGTYTVSKGQTVSSVDMSATVSITSVTSSTCSIQVPYITGYNGGSPITAITANVYLGSTLVGTTSGTTSPLTVTGVPNNAIYSVTLTATNAIGTSTASSGPYFQTPSAPSSPTIGTATLVGTNGATVSFTPSTDNNGSAITGYTAVASPGGATANSATSPISFSGLGSTTSYTFTVYATNAIGNGSSSSASNAITTGTAPVVTYLIVGGGGAASGGGGGGGEVKTGTFTTGGTYNIVIGAGGTPGTNVNNAYPNGVNGANGNSSSVFGLTAIGGGGGGANSKNGTSGASGGGGGPSASVATSGGSGTAGFAGGGNTYLADPYPAGGGGGAGGVGQNPPAYNTSGDGGVGAINNITAAPCSFTGSIATTTLTVTAISSGSLSIGQYVTGTGIAKNTVITAQLTGTTGSTGTYTISKSQTIASESMAANMYWAGGGGGGNYNNSPRGLGGNGGGGDGGGNSSTAGSAGVANTGGGGGGETVGGYGWTGGSGVVIISSPSAATATTGSPTVTTYGGNTIYKFTANGSISF